MLLMSSLMFDIFSFQSGSSRTEPSFRYGNERIGQVPVVLIAMLVFLFHPSAAQDQHWNITIGGGGQFTVLSDRRVGQLLFRGISLTPAFGIEKTGPRTITNLTLSGAILAAHSETEPARQVRQTTLYFDLQHLRLSGGEEDRFRLGIGVALSDFYATRRFRDLINTANRTDFALSLGPAFTALYESSSRAPGWRFSGSAGMGMLSLFSSTNYRDSYDVTEYKNDRNPFRKMQFNGPAECLRLKGKLSVSRRLSVATRIGVDYHWDFYRLRGDQSISQAAHKFQLCYQFYFR